MPQQFASMVELGEDSMRRFAARRFLGERIRGTWEWITYEAFGALINDCRAGLAALGVSAGDRVAVISRNRSEWAIGAYATFGLGAVYVPMYEAQKPEEWAFMLRDSGAKVVLASSERVVNAVAAMRVQLPTLQHVVALDAPPADTSSWAALLAAGRAKPCPALHPSADTLALFAYTSGTTGKPKAALLSHGNITSNIASITSVFRIDPDDMTLSFLPWAHAYGQVVELHILLSVGASTAINDDVTRLLANCEQIRPTILVAVPRVFARIHEKVLLEIEAKPKAVQRLFRTGVRAAVRRNRGQPLSLLERARLLLADRLIFAKVRRVFGGRLHYVISGSAALSRDVAELIDALGIPVYEGYGLTETSPIVSANRPDARKIGSVGKPIPGVRVSIDRLSRERSAEGEIVVRGPNVMRGYHNRPDETAHALASDGAFRTGDIGYLDDDGYLYITGRIKEQYKLENGKYVSPTFLEEQLKASPFVANAMLYGANRPYNVAIVVPNVEALETWGKHHEVVVTDPAHNPAVRELIQRELERCSKEFRSFERPRDFLIAPADFTTENGMLTPTLKLKRQSVLAAYEADLVRLYAPQRAAVAVAAPH